MSVAFDTIPGAGLVAPLFAFEVSSGGAPESPQRLVLIGHKTSSGTLAQNTPAVCTSIAEALQLAGQKSMLYDMFVMARRNAPAQEIWILPVAASGVAATQTVTIDSPPAAGGLGVLRIAGRAVRVTIGAGDNAATVAAALSAAVNAYEDPLTGRTLPVAATVSSAVVTLTARHAGAVAGDIDVVVPTTTAGNAFAGGVATVAAGTSGSGSPDLSTALANLGDDPAHWIVSPFSDDTNLNLYATLLNDTSGRWAWLRQSYGHVITLRTASTGDMTTLGLARNDRHVTILNRPVTAGIAEPAWEWVAGVAGRVVPWLSDGVTGNVSRNQTGLVVEGLSAPDDRSKWPSYATRNALLTAGISTWSVTADGRIAIDKLVTTQRLNAQGQSDTTFRDIQAMGQLMVALTYFRAVLSTEHGQKALADTNPSALQAISTPKDIKATFVHAYQALVDRGVLEDVDGFASRCVVERDTVNRNRVNVFAPLDRVNALDILAANARLYAQYE